METPSSSDETLVASNRHRVCDRYGFLLEECVGYIWSLFIVFLLLRYYAFRPETFVTIPKEVIEKESQQTMKWLDMLSNWDWWMQHNPGKIFSRCLKGIPDRIRANAWKALAMYDENKKQSEFVQNSYQSLVEGSSTWESQISCDVPRTFPTCLDFENQACGYAYSAFYFVGPHCITSPDFLSTSVLISSLQLLKPMPFSILNLDTAKEWGACRPF